MVMFVPEIVRKRLPKVEVVLRSCKSVVPIEQRKEYVITKIDPSQLGEPLWVLVGWFTLRHTNICHNVYTNVF